MEHPDLDRAGETPDGGLHELNATDSPLIPGELINQLAYVRSPLGGVVRYMRRDPEELGTAEPWYVVWQTVYVAGCAEEAQAFVGSRHNLV